MLFVLQWQTKLPQPPDLGLPLCRTKDEFMIEGPDPGKHLTKCYIVVQFLVIPSVLLCPGQLKSKQGAELGSEWQSCCLGRWQVPLARDGGDLSAEPGHVLDYHGERSGGLSLLENIENHALSFLCFHDKCPEDKVLKSLKIPVQGNLQCFQSLLLFLFRPKLFSKFVLN